MRDPGVDFLLWLYQTPKEESLICHHIIKYLDKLLSTRKEILKIPCHVDIQVTFTDKKRIESCKYNVVQYIFKYKLNKIVTKSLRNPLMFGESTLFSREWGVFTG